MIYNDSVKKLMEEKSRGLVLQCLKDECNGRITEVCDIYVPIYRILNEKGYYVKSCQSGYAWKDRPASYITFNESIKSEDIDVLPENYFKRVSEEWYVSIIRRFPPGCDEIELHSLILEDTLILLKWAEDLEPCKIRSML
jgi:hypothetical protein